ncbi:MAG: hypothetical protein HRT68_02735 [Flavobacteriaceae bacterium]|nr:hypothetical protein [Flavobacteriaceae bacterium]
MIDLSKDMLDNSITVLKDKPFHLVANTIEGEIAYMKYTTSEKPINFNYLKGKQANYENLKLRLTN